MILVAISADRSAALDAQDAAREEFEAAGRAIIGNFYVPTLTDTGQAVDLDTLDTFDVDARNSEVAAHTIHTGRSIERGRDDIAARYTAADPIAATAGHVDAARTLEELAAVVYADEQPMVDLIARTAAIITTPGNRDAMTRLTHYGTTNAHDVIAAVARRSTGAARVHALILTGFFAHLAGDGAAANIAYETAEKDCTGERPTLLVLLSTAIGRGVAPADMRAMILDADTVRDTTGAYLRGQ